MSVHLLRYDDYSASSSLAVERELVELIGNHQRPCTFACIPFVLDAAHLHQDGAVRLQPLPAEKVSLVRPLVDQGLIEIALHGWSHVALSPLRNMAEFSDAMPVSTQRKLLQQGRSYLEDSFQRPINLFVPPWNSLGARTVEALREEGLYLVSAGYPGPWRPDPLAEKIAAPVRNMPCWLSFGETERALRLAQRFGGVQSVVGTLLHDYDFVESGYSIARGTMACLEKSIESWKAVSGAEAEPVGPTVDREGPDGWRRARDNSALANLYHRGFFARRFWQRVVRSVYWDEATAARLRILGIVMTGRWPERSEDGLPASLPGIAN